MTVVDVSVVERVRQSYARIREVDRPEVWIYLDDEERTIARAQRVDTALSEGIELPLAGLLVAVKDNIDVIDMPTTAGCPAYTYQPTRSATCVELLVAAGAVVIGKTNLDQFATGLVGTRSPYGAVRNALDPTMISGGSSSGSAVAVALGLVDFALGTDTAGSGRVPAALNGIVSVKPTFGVVSNRGVVPACRNLDCVSVFATSVELCDRVLPVLSQFDPEDPLSREVNPRSLGRFPTIGVPIIEDLGLDAADAELFTHAIDRLRNLPGVTIVEFDAALFVDCGALLYGGALVAERFEAVGDFLTETAPDDVDPAVGSIIRAAGAVSAAQYVADHSKLAILRRRFDLELASIDVFAMPTVPRTFTLEEVQAEPFATNAELGRFNNFCNLLELCAFTVPAGTTTGGRPFGMNLFARAHSDRSLGQLAAAFHGETFNSPVPTNRVLLAVVGAHLSGQPLHHQLTTRHAKLVTSTTTSADYRLFALETTPPKPGLERVAPGEGAKIALEVWELDVGAFGSFVAEIPPPLGVGSLELADGTWVNGFICEPHALHGARDITSFGGWLNYRASLV